MIELDSGLLAWCRIIREKIKERVGEESNVWWDYIIMFEIFKIIQLYILALEYELMNNKSSCMRLEMGFSDI